MFVEKGGILSPVVLKRECALVWPHMHWRCTFSLVRMQNGTAASGNCGGFSGPSHPTPGTRPEEMRSESQWDTRTAVWWKHYSQSLRVAGKLKGQQMSGQTKVVCTYTGISPSFQKEGNPAPCDNTDEPWEHCSLNHVWLFVTPRTTAHRAPLSMAFSRREYWSGLPFPAPGDLPGPEITPASPALAGKFFTTEPPGKLLRTLKVKVKSFSRVRLFATPWTVAYQASQSLGFSRQEDWSGLPFPSPGDLCNPGIEPRSPTL